VKDISMDTAHARLNDILHAFVGFGSLHEPASSGVLQDWRIAIKDNFDMVGELVGVGAPMFADRRAAGSAPAVQRLLDAGARIAGRAQMVELAFGGWGINAARGTPRNPWDAQTVRVAGGSSSGSAVAVAARMATAALGSDTAGSIRMPAALCGVTGLKTTHGLIPLDGVFPLAPSYDSVGPMAHSAEDCARLFEVLARTRLQPMGEPQGWRVVRPMKDDYPVAVEPDVQQALEDAAAVLEGLGVVLHERPTPFALADLTRDAGVLIASEAWAVHRMRFENDPNAFGDEIRGRLDQARSADPGQVAAARRARREATDGFDRWLPADELLLLPTVHCSAPALDSIDESSTPLGQFTRWVNHVGGCAISLPAGFDRHGLPLAIQLVGRGGAEARLLTLGAAFQRATRWHLSVPPLASP
jgi:aspartyl-tRNA(Asn)/glutamyl-tRNA(Gln) amidotransferase subunit A